MLLIEGERVARAPNTNQTGPTKTTQTTALWWRRLISLRQCPQTAPDSEIHRDGFTPLAASADKLPSVPANSALLGLGEPHSTPPQNAAPVAGMESSRRPKHAKPRANFLLHRKGPCKLPMCTVRRGGRSFQVRSSGLC